MDNSRFIEKKVKTKSGEGTIVSMNSRCVTIKMEQDGKSITYSLAQKEKWYDTLLDVDLKSEFESICEERAEKENEDSEARERKKAEEQRDREYQNMHLRKVARPRTMTLKEKIDLEAAFNNMKKDNVMTYQEVEDKHGISRRNGPGVVILEDCILLFSKVDEKGNGFNYHDHFDENGNYVYIGKGKSGDQTNVKENVNVIDTQTNDKKIYLYITFGPENYYYQGEVKLVGYSLEDGTGKDGNQRKEYHFVLEIL